MTLVSFSDIQNNDPATPELFNSRFGEIVDAINGNLDATNLSDGSTTTPKLATDSVTTVKVANDAITPPKWSNPYKFSAYRNGALTVGSPGKITLETELFDTNNNFDTTNNRYTAPVNGYYQFDGSVGFVGTNGSGFQALLYKNGSQIAQGAGGIFFAGPFNSGAPVSKLLQLTAGDYIELWFYSSGMACTVGQNSTYLTGFLVEET